MPVCVICSEELPSEADMRTHLLLSHVENAMSCPFCSLSGITYDELTFHIGTAHQENSMDLQNTPESGQRSSVKPTDPKSKTNHANGTKDSPGPTFSQPSRHHTMSQANGSTSPNAGIALTQGPGASSWTKSSPPTAATPNGIEKSAKEPKVCREKTLENISEHRKAKQKRLSSPKKEKMFSCPFCSLVCSDCFLLQEHVELHLQEQTASEGDVPGAGASAQTHSSARNEPGLQRYECPMCSVVCVDKTSLQDHVELHLNSSTETTAEDFSEDLRLARQLQEEEEKRRREEDARREKEDFKQLQKVFGLDNAGGYRRQMEHNLERAVSRGHMTPTEFHQKRVEMMETLASGVDDGLTRTSGVMEALYEHYQRELGAGARVWLCADTDHYSSSNGDKGWGCGYRNFQMLLSALQRIEQFTALNTLTDSVPSIPQVQALIESGWSEGIDPQGASHFNGKLQGTRAWIGATEIYTVLTAHRVRARIVDFHKATGPGNTHPRLFEWIKNYFSLHSSRGARLPPRVVKTDLPPIYLQHQGHSRSIVGVEEKKNGSVFVLILDPGCPPSEMKKLLNPNTASASVSRLRKSSSNLKHSQYQLVVTEGVLTPEEKRNRVVNSRTLRAERIP